MVMAGLQSFSSSMMDKQTVPEGYKMGWNSRGTPLGGIDLAFVQSFSPGNAFFAGNPKLPKHEFHRSVRILHIFMGLAMNSRRTSLLQDLISSDIVNGSMQLLGGFSI